MTWNCIVIWGGAGLLVGQLTAWTVHRITSWRPVGLPLVSAGLWAAAAGFGGGAPALLLTWWCACLMCTDIASRRLPNQLTAAGAVGVSAYAIAVGDFEAVLVGGGVLFGCYLAVHLLMPRAFGAGDVKLAFALGGLAGLFGTHAWVCAALLAPLFTGVVGLAYRALRRAESSVPHGPSMCLATLLALTAAGT
ncbi:MULTISPECIES: prepilin peptidase [Nocardiaceae]|uniref:prepilin peptidase n=1 Tax=Nocardiaceae TaxID=85025 RepID=UPI001E53AE02|nr:MULTISPECIES: A24 family peptidase [Rhodococcus]MCZ4275278.1 A24 family peptidase [Rhodococcus yunnanensis]